MHGWTWPTLSNSPTARTGNGSQTCLTVEHSYVFSKKISCEDLIFFDWLKTCSLNEWVAPCPFVLCVNCWLSNASESEMYWLSGDAIQTTDCMEQEW